MVVERVAYAVDPDHVISPDESQYVILVVIVYVFVFYY